MLVVPFVHLQCVKCAYMHPLILIVQKCKTKNIDTEKAENFMETLSLFCFILFSFDMK